MSSTDERIPAFKAVPELVALLALSFLWPYYQRAFYRVTLFHSLGDPSLAYFGLFLVVFLAGCIAFALWAKRMEAVIARSSMLLIFAVLSVVATMYLSGMVVPVIAGPAQIAFGVLATTGFALSMLVVSGAWALLLMRIAYARGLFNVVAVLVGSAMVSCLLSPSAVVSPLSTGIMPVFGVFVAGVGAWVLQRRLPEEKGGAKAGEYSTLKQAPYVNMWLLPLIVYFLFSVLHAVGFASDATTEVHVNDGHLLGAISSFSVYVVFFFFSTLLLAASLNSLRSKLSNQRKAMFWVATMDVLIGIFSGLFLSSLLDGLAADVVFVTSSVNRCFIVLLAVIVLFMTYQNSLSPLKTFGLFFFGVFAVEKVLVYLVFPLLFSAHAGLAEQVAQQLGLVLGALSLVVLLVFLVRLCRSDALQLLFLSSTANVVVGDVHESADMRVAAVGRLASEQRLTKRESDILYYLSLGYSAKRIGETLYISERTVQTHTQNIYRKLNVHTRQMVIDLVEQEVSEGNGSVAPDHV